MLDQLWPAIWIERDGDRSACILDHGKRLGCPLLVGERGGADMDCLDFIEGNRAAAVAPVSGRGRFVIKGILRFTFNGADESKRGLVLAAPRISKIDLGGQGVVGNHAAEKIGRDAAREPCRRAEARHADSDVEAGATRHGHDGVAPVHRFDGQEINQGVSAA